MKNIQWFVAAIVMLSLVFTAMFFITQTYAQEWNTANRWPVTTRTAKGAVYGQIKNSTAISIANPSWSATQAINLEEIK